MRTLRNLIVGFTLVFIFTAPTQAQISNTGMTDRVDSVELGKLVISGFVDAYLGTNFNQSTNGNRMYSVSQTRVNETNINLAYIDFRYQNQKVRLKFTPGFGTYVDANYATEKGSIKNLIEANVGVKLSQKKEIWLDAGVLGSPFTNETAISKDHFMYTRAMAPEYVPYYLAGARLTYPLTPKLTTYLYVLNGWQQIYDQNNSLSAATQMEYKPNKNLLINWDTYLGNEKSNLSPDNRMRYFSDVYAIINLNTKWSATTCVYGGIQQRFDSLTNKLTNKTWWQANVVVKYNINKHHHLAARVEYFEDMNHVVTNTETFAVKGFNSYSAGLCFTKKITDNALFRLEGRHFFSNRNVYLKNNTPTNTSTLLITNLTVWF